MLFVDNHCHFEQLTVQEQQAVLSQQTVIGVASGLASCQQLLQLAEQYPNLKICLGIHPEYRENYADFAQVKALILHNHKKIAGIGEIGLPYFNLAKLPSQDQQQAIAAGSQLFEQFIQLAQQTGLAVNLHCVETSATEAIACLKKYQIKRALFHWFEGTAADLQHIITQGWFISVSPDVMYNIKYQQFVKTVPLEIICLESDGPWCYNGERGVPAMLSQTAHFLAQMHNCSIDKIYQQTTDNSQALWQLS